MARNEQLTTLEYALLGLATMSPMSGYDLHKVFATTPLAHFSSSPGAIYPALKRLEKRGLLAAALDRTTEARPRRVFSATEAGQAALEAWLRQPVTREQLIRSDGSPILRFGLAGMGGRLSRKELVAYLESYREVVAAYIKELEAFLPGLAGEEMVVPRLSLELGLGGYRSELAWTERAMAELQPPSARPRKRRG